MLKFNGKIFKQKQDMFLHPNIYKVKNNFTMAISGRYHTSLTSLGLTSFVCGTYQYYVPADIMNYERHIISVLSFPVIHNLKVIIRNHQ